MPTAIEATTFLSPALAATIAERAHAAHISEPLEIRRLIERGLAAIEVDGSPDPRGIAKDGAW